MNEARSLFEEGLRLVTPQRWKDCIKHVIGVEDKMCTLGHIVDDITDRFIIEVGDDSDDSAHSGNDMNNIFLTVEIVNGTLLAADSVKGLSRTGNCVNFESTNKDKFSMTKDKTYGRNNEDNEDVSDNIWRGDVN